MQRIKQIFNPQDSEISEEQVKKLMANMNRVFFCAQHDVEKCIEDAYNYYRSNPGEDYE